MRKVIFFVAVTDMLFWEQETCENWSTYMGRSWSIHYRMWLFCAEVAIEVRSLTLKVWHYTLVAFSMLAFGFFSQRVGYKTFWLVCTWIWPLPLKLLNRWLSYFLGDGSEITLPCSTREKHNNSVDVEPIIFLGGITFPDVPADSAKGNFSQWIKELSVLNYNSFSNGSYI